MNKYPYKIIVICNMLWIFINHAIAQDIKSKVDSVNSIPHEYIVSNLKSSINIFEENAKSAKGIQYKYGEARSLENLGKAYYLSGKYDLSTETYLKVFTIYEQLNLPSELSSVFGEYGYQLKRRNLSKALHYMELGIALAEEHELITRLTGLYDNYGVLQEMNDNLDSARYFYQKALDLKTELNDSIGIPYSLNNLAGVYAIKGYYKKAFEFLQQSDKYREKEQGNYGRFTNQVMRGDIYYRMGKLDSAALIYEECLTNSQDNNHGYQIRYCYDQLTKIYKQKKEYKKAFATQSKFSAFKDSVLNFQTHTKIAELEIAYETEKKDREIAEKNLNIRQKSGQLYFALGIIVLLSIIALWIYRSQKLKRERIRRDLEIENKLKQAEYDKKLSEDKIRISRELHDNIGSQLTFIIGTIDNLIFSKKENIVFEKLGSLKNYSKNTLTELRNTIWAMKNEGAELNQLILKLNELKQQVNSNFTNLHLQIKNDINHPIYLNALQMLNLFRIVQEAIQNTIKHANAKNIIIIFEENSKGFYLKIIDNGIGFNPKIVECGSGLRNMKDRCVESKGDFRIKSQKGNTQIICDFCIK